MQKVITDARLLGAESVVIIGGGEPLIYDHIKELIAFICSSGMIPVIITNGCALTKDLCSFLWDNNTSVLLKCDSLDEQRQDLLSGHIGSYKAMQNSLELLIQKGFNRPGSKHLRAGLSFVVTRINYDDILSIWKFCRINGFYPNFEEFIPRGRGLTNYSRLYLNNETVLAIKEKLLEYDRINYGYDWLIHSPLPGHGCFQPICSVYITSSGDVRPCPDIEVSFSNIGVSSIRDIINSPFFQLSRNIEKHLKGKCFSCSHNRICIGCRGNAFSVGINNGMLPEDALCSPDPLCLK
jgi:radical SAM protein with 4Fe4S-binding SPASM domain